MFKDTRAWFRTHTIPVQVIGATVTLIGSLCWMPVLFYILQVLGEFVQVHWFIWVLYWAMAVVKLVTWFIYSVVDADGDGAEGQ